MYIKITLIYFENRYISNILVMENNLCKDDDDDDISEPEVI